ncbi:MAG TPA: M20/M25/M40 family metallo-hydrolase [Caulobacteraceae bacterium]|nr:M20/M25/M40 family metallo-hydrolase [Caulobacteraceae bacterium]
MRAWTLFACLAAAVLLAWVTARPSAFTPSQPASPSAAGFNAELAMADVEAISRAPHPTGSAENARARDHLVGRLRALGLSVEVQRADTVTQAEWMRGGAAGATVENVIGVLPGRDRSLPALTLMSHYDSVPNSPGAADDAAGVAASIEVARALIASGPRERDVILLVTDGEEAGLHGARAFFDAHPLAARVGAVVNLEARGSSGPAMMFETGGENGGWIALFDRSTGRVSSNSLMAWIYDQMPNGTDFTVPKDKGVPGLNLAFIGRPFDYHSATATPAKLDRDSLQHLGDQALGIARAAANARALPKAEPNAVYADVFGRWFVRYPAWGGWVVLGLAAALAGVAVAGAARRGWVVPLDALRGAGLGLFVMTAALLALRAAGGFSGGLDSFAGSRNLLAQLPLYLAGCAGITTGVGLLSLVAVRRPVKRLWPVLAVLALGLLATLGAGKIDPVSAGATAVGAVLAALVFGRAAGAWCLWTGLLAPQLLLAVVVQALAPEAAFLFAWPLLAASLSAAAVMTLAGGEFPRAAALAIGGALAIVTVGWLAGVAGFMFTAVGADWPETLAVFALLALAPLWPLAAVWTRAKGAGAASAALLLGGVAAVAVVACCPRPSPRHPQAVQAFHLAEPSAGRYWRASALDALDPWSARALAAGGGKTARTDLPAAFVEDGWRAPVRPFSAQAGQARLVREGERVAVTVLPAAGRELRLSIRTDVPVRAVAVQGRPLKLLGEPGEWSKVRWQAPAGGVTVAFTPERAGTVELRWAEVRDGSPPDAPPLPPRAPHLAPWGLSDTTVVVGEARLAW